MSEPALSARVRPTDPALIAERAQSNGWHSGQHIDRDKQRRLNHYNPKVLAQQDAVLNTFAVWNWAKTDCKRPFEECKESCLRFGAPIPELHELKDFWRFYKDQSVGHLKERPTALTLRARAKEFKAGFRRLTGNILSDEDTEEINRWLQQVLPSEEGSGVKDVQMPKYNYQPVDLDRNIKALWTRTDLGFIHERHRIQFHFLLLLFCHGGSRQGALLNKGIPYKDIGLVLRRTADGRREFIFKLDQRYVKNNKDPENKKYGVIGKEHRLIRYNAVAFLLSLAIADGALDRERFLQMLQGSGEGPIDWNDNAKDLPVCKEIDRRGIVDHTKPMSGYVFKQILKKLLMAEYGFTRPSLHMIRRELGKQLDERYTETQRSQHLLQADPRVFGQSYVASVSSCDGFAAFMREQPDHSVVDYFQGLSQFWQAGLPTQLPVAKKAELVHLPEIMEHDQEIQKAADEDAKRKAKQIRQNALKRLEKRALETYRLEELKRLRKQRLVGESLSFAADCSDPLNELIPQKGRLAAVMSNDSDKLDQDGAVNDIVFLLKTEWGVFYHQNEAPEKGACPFCNESMEKLQERQRSRHIRCCRKKDVAKSLGILQSDLRFCYFCMAFYKADEWEQCEHHLQKPWKRYGSLMYRHTLIRPAFCLLCKQGKHYSTSDRMRYWERDADAIRHLEQAHGWLWGCAECNFSSSNREEGCSHLHDVHGYNIPKLSSAKSDSYRMSSSPDSDLSLQWAKASDVDSFDISQFISFPPTPEAKPTLPPSPPLSLDSVSLQLDVLSTHDSDRKEEVRGANEHFGNTDCRASFVCDPGLELTGSSNQSRASVCESLCQDVLLTQSVEANLDEDWSFRGGSPNSGAKAPTVADDERTPMPTLAITGARTEPRIRITLRTSTQQPRRGEWLSPRSTTGKDGKGQLSPSKTGKRIRLKLNSTAERLRRTGQDHDDEYDKDGRLCKKRRKY